jgi:hypothetical protein
VKGELKMDDAMIDKVSWNGDNSQDSTHPVGKKLPNGYGLFDMLGNVGEWATDSAGKSVLCGPTFEDATADVKPTARLRWEPSWQESDPQIPKSRWWLSDPTFALTFGVLGCSQPKTESTEGALKNDQKVVQSEGNEASEGKEVEEKEGEKEESDVKEAPKALEPKNIKLELQGVSFDITATYGDKPKLTIQPKGLKLANDVIEHEIDGTLTKAEVGDLNGDRFPEVYVYITGSGSGSYGTLIAYSSNKNKSLSMINLPTLEDTVVKGKEGATKPGMAAVGYMGHDQFNVMEGVFTRRFPTYQGKDTNANPTGKTRLITYKLEAGEASWQLVPTIIEEY